MRIFVTGATGVIGIRAVPALIAAGHQVTAVARSEAKADLVCRLGGEPTFVDLFDPTAIDVAVKGHDAVAHLATHIPPMSKAARPGAWDTNERLRKETSNYLVDAALAAGAGHYLQESICFPYRSAGDTWIDEDSPIDHDGVFVGAGVAEAASARFTVGGGTGVVLRFAQYHGPGSHHVQAFNRLVRRRINPFVGSPDAYTSFVHADDAGTAVAAALTAPSGIYNVADDEPLTRADAGRAVAEALGVKPPHTTPAGVQKVLPKTAKALTRSLRISNQRFKATTGWVPAHRSIRGSWAP